MTETVEISTDGLRQHAATLDSMASQLSSARETADATSGAVSDGAFGLLCSFLAPFVQWRIMDLSNQITSLSETETDAATAIREIAVSFDECETQLADAIDDATRALG